VEEEQRGRRAHSFGAKFGKARHSDVWCSEVDVLVGESETSIKLDFMKTFRMHRPFCQETWSKADVDCIRRLSLSSLYLLDSLNGYCIVDMDHNHLPPPVPSSIPEIALSPALDSETSSSSRHLSDVAPSPSRQTTTQTFLTSYSTQPPSAPSETSEANPPSPALSNQPLLTSTSLRDNLDVSILPLYTAPLRPVPTNPKRLHREVVMF
jgi:hypothetical protein